MPDELVTILTTGLSRLGIEAERLYPQLIFFFWIKSLASFVLGLLVQAVGYTLLIKKIVPAIRAEAITLRPGQDPSFQMLVLLVIGAAISVVSITFTIVTIINFPSSMANIFAPEVGFLNSLIEGAKRR